eukprot:2933109-Rhodomonas_salina.2
MAEMFGARLRRPSSRHAGFRRCLHGKRLTRLRVRWQLEGAVFRAAPPVQRSAWRGVEGCELDVSGDGTRSVEAGPPHLFDDPRPAPLRERLRQVPVPGLRALRSKLDFVRVCRVGADLCGSGLAFR